MGLSKLGARNRAIFAAVQVGVGIDQLAAAYQLNPRSIEAIVLGEKHKRAISPEPAYRNLRQTGAS